MKLDARAPDFDTIRSRLSYDPETGHFTMRVSAGRRKAGSRAGYADKLGYWKVAINGRWMYAHRLAWALMNGDKWPEGEIDHINGNPSDNRIENLRVVTRSQNVVNAKFNSANSSGYRGVCVVRRHGKIRYQADIRRKGRKAYLGTFDTAEEAHSAYLKAALDEYGEYFPQDGQQVFIETPSEKPKQTALEV